MGWGAHGTEWILQWSRGNRVGVDLSFEATPQTFFGGGQTCLSYFLEEKVDEFWGPSCLPVITWIPAPTVGVTHIPPAQPGGVNFGSDAQESFLRLSGCCTSCTSLCSATRLTLLSYRGSANRALISFFEKLQQRMRVPR